MRKSNAGRKSTHAHHLRILSCDCWTNLKQSSDVDWVVHSLIIPLQRPQSHHSESTVSSREVAGADGSGGGNQPLVRAARQRDRCCGRARVLRLAPPASRSTPESNPHQTEPASLTAGRRPATARGVVVTAPRKCPPVLSASKPLPWPAIRRA